MVRREVHGPDSGLAVDERPHGLDVDPIRVNRNRHDGSSGLAQRFANRLASKLLDGDDVAGPKKGAGREEEPHLAPSRDDHILPTRGQAARRCEHLGESLSEIPAPVGSVLQIEGAASACLVVEDAVAIHADRPSVGARQRLDRYQAHVRAPVTEVEGARPEERPEGNARRLVEVEAHPGRDLAPQNAERARELAGIGPGNEGTARLGAGRPAFCLQLAVGGDDGVAVEPESMRERPRAGQAITWAKPAAPDVPGE